MVKPVCGVRIAGVHDGSYAALFHRPQGSDICLFDEIVGVLRRVGGDEESGLKLPLYLTGHSMGGAVASVFAQALRAEVHPFPDSATLIRVA